jgi:hypothetical protein
LGSNQKESVLLAVFCRSRETRKEYIDIKV